ncbi:MAG: hypothetical protein ACR2MZ_13790 [Candidatus Dormibacter sp.]|uniref:hypothetical protein n=1 Tax=Candidatus Dormibacter sp. TaxID=2973982 RepID=UPI000DB8D2FA|nr:MAG: hypothetical protein DLM66_13655 [Candidatus Dormibacteraeota bacterium]
MTEGEFDERFRNLVPPECRPGLDARRATFARGQGRIDTPTMLAQITGGVLRAWAEWRDENRQR